MMFPVAALFTIGIVASSVMAIPSSSPHTFGLTQVCNTTYLNLTNNMAEDINMTLYNAERGMAYFAPGTFDNYGSMIIPSNSTALLCRSELCGDDDEVYLTVTNPIGQGYDLFGALLIPDGEHNPQDCAMEIFGYNVQKGTAYTWSHFIPKSDTELGHTIVNFCTPMAYDLLRCDQPLRTEA